MAEGPIAPDPAGEPAAAAAAADDGELLLDPADGGDWAAAAAAAKAATAADEDALPALNWWCCWDVSNELTLKSDGRPPFPATPLLLLPLLLFPLVWWWWWWWCCWSRKGWKAISDCENSWLTCSPCSKRMEEARRACFGRGSQHDHDVSTTQTNYNWRYTNDQETEQQQQKKRKSKRTATTLRGDKNKSFSVCLGRNTLRRCELRRVGLSRRLQLHQYQNSNWAVAGSKERGLGGRRRRCWLLEGEVVDSLAMLWGPPDGQREVYTGEEKGCWMSTRPGAPKPTPAAVGLMLHQCTNAADWSPRGGHIQSPSSSRPPTSHPPTHQIYI